MACAPVRADQLRARLQAMAQQPDPYPFLSVVEDYLAVVPDDHAIRAAAVGALVKKGLFSVAAELGQACPPTGADGAELRRAAEQLARAESEIVAWAATDQCFSANLAALRSRGDAGARIADEIEQAWPALAADLTLHQANDGNLQVRASRSDGRRLWLPAALDFANKIEAGVDAASLKGQFPAPFLLDGVGGGWLVPRLHAATTHTFLTYSPAIYIVETNARALALVLRLHDWGAALGDERVYLFSGPSAWEQWSDLMRTDTALPPPPQFICLTRWPGTAASPAQQHVREVTTRRDTMLVEARQRAEQVYAGRDRAFWANRFAHAGPSDPLRVLCVTSRFTTFLQHSMRDLMAALERAGCVTRLLIEEKDHLTIPRHAHMQAFAELRPDLVVMIDHHRHEQPEAFIKDVPFVCWIQDELPWLFDAQTGRKLGPLDFTIGFGLTQCVLQHGYPPERFMPCRLAIDPAKFAPVPEKPEPDPDLQCDVAYVSHHSETPQALAAHVRAMFLDPAVQSLMDAVFEQTHGLFMSQRFNGSYDLERLWSQVETKTGITITDPAVRGKLMGLYFRPLADRCLRHAALTWVADWADATGRTLHLYGNGWEQHARFGRYARGPAQHGQHLGQIARHAAINLHLGLTTALHQRVLETAGAGGFLMVRYHPQDFFPESTRSLMRYLTEHGIDRPVKLPLDQVPPECIETLRQRAAITGRQVPEFYEITGEWLLSARARQRHGDRHDFANLALPGFEQITFDSPESFAQRAQHFIENPDQRQGLARQMQAAVQELFTYDALVRRIIAFVSHALHSAAHGPVV